MFNFDYANSIQELLEKLKNSGSWQTVSTRKGRRTIYYINLPCSFDIETYSFEKNEEKQAIMYVWQLCINGCAMYGRTWEEFLNAMEVIKDFFQLSETRRLPIYVHNLSYEFGWIKNYFKWVMVFAREERKPLKALTTDGFEFRCSYILAGCNLDTVGKNLTTYKVQKKTGDLDYHIARTPLTPLDKKELGYCLNDVYVVSAYIQEQIEMYGNIAKIPMTNTGRVRQYCREHCLKSQNYINTIKNLQLTPQEYLFIKDAFMGGFTHANYRKAMKVYTEVHSMDFTSSYPTVLIAEPRFPMSSGELVDLTPQNYNQLVQDNCLIFNVRFNNLIEKDNIPDHYLSVSKCFDTKAVVEDNGRVISAETLSTTITEVDLDIINQCYDYDDIEFGTCVAYKAGFLPKEFIECVLEFYVDKTTLKDVKGKEVEYQLKKGMLNSCYGMLVTDICSDVITFNGEWGTQEANIDECIEKYNNDRKRFTYYPWGIYTTAYARRNLWYGILNLGQDYIYSDTDSVKFRNLDKHNNFFDTYNEWITERLETTLDHYNLPHELIKPKTVKGVEKPLGVWDYEGCYSRYETLGSKRYLVEKDGEISCTIAGVNKKKTSKWLSMQDDPFKTFNNNMTVPVEYAGRNIVSYFDTGCEGTVTDCNGVPYHYKELSYIHMDESEYNLTMSDKYLELLEGKTEYNL